MRLIYDEDRIINLDKVLFIKKEETQYSYIHSVVFEIDDKGFHKALIISKETYDKIKELVE